MMNYRPNKKNWKVGDIVIHDADRKGKDMLMKVVSILKTKSGIQYMTEYISEDKKYRNKLGLSKVWCNPKECLHDPLRFNIKVNE